MHIPDDKADLAGCGSNAACTTAPEGECRTGLTCTSNVRSIEIPMINCAELMLGLKHWIFSCARLPCCAGGRGRCCGRLSLRTAVLLTAAAFLVVVVIVTVPAIVVSTRNSRRAASSSQSSLDLGPQVLALPWWRVCPGPGHCANVASVTAAARPVVSSCRY